MSTNSGKKQAKQKKPSVKKTAKKTAVQKPKDPRGDNGKATQFKKGQSGNPKGKPPGTRNFTTLYRDALKSYADLNKRKPTELEEAMVQTAIKKAIKGDFRFYKDIMDRNHGQAVKSVDVTSDGKPLEPKANTIVFVDFSGEIDEDGNIKA